ncbi:hypothetical protein LQW54_011254 [Pestalotiopsis sp. IQ-011]
MASHEYHLVRIPKKHGGNYYSHVNHLISCYKEPKYINSDTSITSDVSVMAEGNPQQITAALSEAAAEGTEDIQNGFKKYYAVFHNEAGGDWAEITLLGTREGLTAFVAWSCGLDTDDDDDSMGPVVFDDPLRGVPKAFKDSIGYSPIIAFAIRRPEGDNLSDAGEYIKELLSKSIEIEASVARGLIENIVVPDAKEDDQAEEGSSDEDDEAEEGSNDEDGQAE